MAKIHGNGLTELEGAILTEIGHRGHNTAFQVRRAFEMSPSSSWSGSAGAVYPAIKRLTEAALIIARQDNSKRGTRLLSLSDAGRAALEAWFCNTDTACGLGVDPFRLRAGLWETLPATRRQTLIAALRRTITAEIPKLQHRQDLDAVEAIGNELAIAVQKLRLDWLNQLAQTIPSAETD